VRFEVNEKCVGCLACIRVCPSEAIAVDGDVVRIVDESCIRAGACVPACPHDAIRAVGELAEAVALAERGDAALILSVESDVHFDPCAAEQVVNACHAAGFRIVSRGIVGDELVAEQYRRLMRDPGWETLIRSTCPVVIEKVRNDYPDLVPYLAPIMTPVAAEAAHLRAVHGADLSIVYAGVCVADGDGDVDAVVTFEELAQIFARRGIELSQQPRYFTRIPAVRQRYMSTPGGLPLPVLQEESQTSRRFRKIRGIGALDLIARAVLIDKEPLGFVDFLPCEGCLDHPLLGPREELYRRRRVAQDAEPRRSALPVVDTGMWVSVEKRHVEQHNGRRSVEGDIRSLIDAIGRAPSGADWDCGACGFSTCRAFAKALLRGRATYRQCPPYQARSAAEAREQAAVDKLTGLATYGVLQDRLTQELARSHRTQEPCGILFLDLDGFKELNDTYGHEAGNQLLASVGRELRRVVRATDVAARYGGDEFVMVLVGTDREGVLHVGELVRSSVERVSRALGYATRRVTASVGAVSYDPKAHLPEDVLQAADRALYRAKASGGNCVVFDDEGDETEPKVLTLQS
jgi:diguanylate cyclase (GGDEF)-like protein